MQLYATISNSWGLQDPQQMENRRMFFLSPYVSFVGRNCPLVWSCWILAAERPPESFCEPALICPTKPSTVVTSNHPMISIDIPWILGEKCAKRHFTPCWGANYFARLVPSLTKWRNERVREPSVQNKTSSKWLAETDGWSISSPLLDVQQRVTEPDLSEIPTETFEPFWATFDISFDMSFYKSYIFFKCYCQVIAVSCSMISMARPQYLWCDGLGFGPGSPAAQPRASQGPGHWVQGPRCRGPCRGATGEVEALVHRDTMPHLEKSLTFGLCLLMS